MKIPKNIGAWCLLLAVVYFAAQYIVQASIITPYDIRFDTVSELGSTDCQPFIEPLKKDVTISCSPLHTVMNAAFIIFGIGLFVGVLSTRKIWPSNKFTKTGLVLIIISGAIIAGIGLMPGNLYPFVHGNLATLHFLLQNTGLVLLGLGTINKKFWLGNFTLIMGAVGLGGLIMFNSLAFHSDGYGIWQRATAYPLAIWAIFLGIMILKNSFSVRR